MRLKAVLMQVSHTSCQFIHGHFVSFVATVNGSGLPLCPRGLWGIIASLSGVDPFSLEIRFL